MAQASESERLLSLVSELTGDAYLKVEETLGDGFVRLKVGEAERRQAKHDIRSVEDIVIELLRNSRDAGAGQIFVAFHKEGDDARLVTVIDDGCGIPSNLLDRVFEPRVTSKLEDMKLDKYGVHGRGMALYAVRSAAKRAYIPYSEPGRGCVISVAADLSELPERKDQSTWPTVRLRPGSAALRGPRNVPRLITEFKLEHPEVRLYLGSASEILSTMRLLAREPDAAGAAAAGAIANASDAKSALRIARETYGLRISERSAHRVVRGELQATEVLPGMLGEEPDDRRAARETGGTARRLARRLSDDDIAELADGIGKVLDAKLAKYFVSIDGRPAVTRSGDEIRISVRLRPDTEV